MFVKQIKKNNQNIAFPLELSFLSAQYYRLRVFYRFSEKLYALDLPISKRYQKNGSAKFIKLCPGGFAEYTYPQFQNLQEFALDGGVIFDTIANSKESHADGVFIQHLSVQYEFGF